MTGYTYEQAGVSIAAGNALVRAIAPLAKATRRPGADAELESTARQHVDGRRLLRQDHRVAVVVREHERTDPQRRRRVRHSHERGDRCDLVIQVVGPGEHRNAEVLGLACERSQFVGMAESGRLDRESERAGGRRGHDRGR